MLWETDVLMLAHHSSFERRGRDNTSLQMLSGKVLIFFRRGFFSDCMLIISPSVFSWLKWISHLSLIFSFKTHSFTQITPQWISLQIMYDFRILFTATDQNVTPRVRSRHGFCGHGLPGKRQDNLHKDRGKPGSTYRKLLLVQQSPESHSSEGLNP